MTPIVPDRGPRPWRDRPRTGAERAVVLAWVELTVVVALAANVALYAALVLPGARELACFDSDEAPTCGVLPPPPSVLDRGLFVAAWVAVLAAAVAAVVIARRHRRGVVSLRGLAVARAAPLVLLLGMHETIGVFPG